MSLALHHSLQPSSSQSIKFEPPTINLASGEHLFHEGDTLEFVYEIVEGIVVLYKMGIDGTRQLIGIRFKGDSLAISGLPEHYCSAIAARFTRVKRTSLAAIEREITADSRFANRLLAGCQRELIKTREQLLIVGCRSSTGRVAALLQIIGAHSDNPGPSFDLPLTRREMGDYLGITIETVSRTMTKLKSLGVIALPRTDHVTILDRQRLCDLANGLDEGAARGRIMA